jgi:hypothetical protein
MPVVISGVDEVLGFLDKFRPAAAKEVEREVKHASMPVVSKARGFAPSTPPLSGWGNEVGLWANKSYQASEIRAGIGFSDKGTKPNRNGFSYTAYIYNRSIAGAIYETAGRKSPNGRPVAPSVQHYANAGTPQARADYRVRNSSKRYSQSANPNAGKQFIGSLGELYKVPRIQGQTGRVSRKMNGRLIYRAWAADQGKVLGAVAKAYSTVIQKYNAGEF